MGKPRSSGGGAFWRSVLASDRAAAFAAAVRVVIVIGTLCIGAGCAAPPEGGRAKTVRRVSSAPGGISLPHNTAAQIEREVRSKWFGEVVLSAIGEHRGWRTSLQSVSVIERRVGDGGSFSRRVRIVTLRGSTTPEWHGDFHELVHTYVCTRVEGHTADYARLVLRREENPGALMATNDLCRAVLRAYPSVPAERLTVWGEPRDDGSGTVVALDGTIAWIYKVWSPVGDADVVLFRKDAREIDSRYTDMFAAARAEAAATFTAQGGTVQEMNHWMFRSAYDRLLEAALAKRGITNWLSQKRLGFDPR